MPSETPYSCCKVRIEGIGLRGCNSPDRIRDLEVGELNVYRGIQLWVNHPLTVTSLVGIDSLGLGLPRYAGYGRVHDESLRMPPMTPDDGRTFSGSLPSGRVTRKCRSSRPGPLAGIIPGDAALPCDQVRPG